MLRQEVGKDRREIVKANMLLTNSEAARFWPLYDQYRSEIHKVGDRRLKVITDYAANRDSMSEDEANRLDTELLQGGKGRAGSQEEYVKRIKKGRRARLKDGGESR